MNTLKMTIVALSLFGVFVTSAVQAARPLPGQGSWQPTAKPEPVPGTRIAYTCYTTRLGDMLITNCF
jgi:hypothetical protein